MIEGAVLNPIDAERALLGSVLINQDIIYDVCDIVENNHFNSELHQQLYGCMINLMNRHEPIDPITLSTEAGGEEEYIDKLAQAIATTVNAEHHAAIVRASWTRRSLIKEAAYLDTAARDPHSDVQDAVDRAQGRLIDCYEGESPASNSEELSTLLKEAEAAANRGDGVVGLPTGYVRLDRDTTGMEPGELWVLAARPSQGKTSLALNMAVNVIKSGGKVAIFSMEMSRKELLTRIISSESEIEGRLWKSGRVPDADWTTIVRVSGECAPWLDRNLFLYDSARQSPLSIRAALRKLMRKNKVDLVIVDYLQLARHHDRHVDREEYSRVTECSKEFKVLAKEMGVPVLLLSQLSRGIEQRSPINGYLVPVLSDLRSSGEIENDADVVLGLSLCTTDGKRDQAKLIILKCRKGPTRTVLLEFVGKYTKFTSKE